MEITQKFKCKDADGKLVDKEMKLEFREIDRCRRSDAKLYSPRLPSKRWERSLSTGLWSKDRISMRQISSC